MDYIEQLRSKVGHQPIILVGATMLIIDEQNRLLMQLRSDNGMWGTPGGYMDLGETIEDTARRETLEETGIKIGNMSLFSIYSGPKLCYEYPNGDQVQMVSIVYITKDYSFVSENHDKEVREIRFFPIKSLPDNISPPVKPIIEDYLNKMKNNRIEC
jgi:8-oxo-dGTP pyrophosphatase MutT (NUDIX family)